MVVLLTYGLCNRKKPVSHLTSAARLACSTNTSPGGIDLGCSPGKVMYFKRKGRLLRALSTNVRNAPNRIQRTA
jgi:hypothetical protein